MTKVQWAKATPLHPFLSRLKMLRSPACKNNQNLLRSSWSLIMRSHRKALRYLATLSSPRVPFATSWRKIRISTQSTWWFKWSIAPDNHWKISSIREIPRVNLPTSMKEVLSIDHKTWRYSNTWSTASLRFTRIMCCTEIWSLKTFSSTRLGKPIPPRLETSVLQECLIRVAKKWSPKISMGWSVSHLEASTNRAPPSLTLPIHTSRPLQVPKLTWHRKSRPISSREQDHQSTETSKSTRVRTFTSLVLSYTNSVTKSPLIISRLNFLESYWIKDKLKVLSISTKMILNLRW